MQNLLIGESHQVLMPSLLVWQQIVAMELGQRKLLHFHISGKPKSLCCANAAMAEPTPRTAPNLYNAAALMLDNSIPIIGSNH